MFFNLENLKSTITCFKEVNIDERIDLSHSFLPIDTCVRINGKPAPLIQWGYSVIDKL